MKKLLNSPYIDLFLILSLVLISFFIIFSRLGVSTLYDWDESRNAQNALEMLKSNNWVVSQYNSMPDLWNLKPPFSIWLMALGFKLFGISEITVRIWSALFALGTIIIIYYFGILIKNRFIGFIAALSLLLNRNFVGFHSAISGDVDAAVAFFITLSLYFFFLFTKKNKPYFLIFAAIPISLVFLTKGVIVIIPILVILIYLVLTHSIRQALFTKQFIYSLILFFLLTAPWFIARHIKNPDYFQLVIQKDVITRISTPLEGHIGNNLYYFNILGELYGIFHYIIVIILFYLILFKKDHISLLLMLWMIVILGIFTSSQTKILWYLTPLYPAISLSFGYGFYFVYQAFQSKFLSIIVLLPVLFFLISSMQVVSNSFYTYVNPLDLTIKSMKTDLQKINNVLILDSQINQSTFFYLSSSIKGRIIILEDLDKLYLDKNDAVITLNESVALFQTK